MFDVDSFSKVAVVFILLGQSNMFGFNTQIEDYPNILQRENHFAKIWVNDKWENLSQFNNSAYEAGPELSFAKAMTDEIGQIFIIKIAPPGTNLYYDWNPDNSLYYNALSEINAGIESLMDEGYSVDIRGICWMQGESDGMEYTFAYNYENNLNNFISRIRSDIRAKNTPFIIGELSLQQSVIPYLSEIRNSQLNVSISNRNVILLDTDSLTIQSDNLHFDEQGYIDLGNNFAKTIIQYHTPKRNVDPSVYINESIWPM